MIRATLLGTAFVMTLTGCARIADSRLNPLNWFGASTQAPVDENGVLRPLVPEGRMSASVDGRVMLDTVTALSVDRTPGGAIVRATGVAPTQGYYNAELIQTDVSNGVLTLAFRAQAPTAFEPAGSTRSRQINAAYIVDTADLSGIRTVRVQAANNARTSAR